MPYITSSGEIEKKQPWGLSKIIALFWSVLNFFFMFFRTLISPGSHSRGDQFTQDFRPGTVPHHVTSENDLSAKLKGAGNKLVVIDFFATWCGPCKMIAPYLQEMAAEMSDVVFLKVDVDECDSIARNYEVRAMPTIVFIRNGKQVESFTGANIQKLKSTVSRYR